MAAPQNSDFLGTMPLGRLLARIALPSSVALVVNSLYNLVDTIFVGQGVGPIGLAAVTLLFPFRIVVMSFGGLVGVGAASVVSRALGAGQEERARATTGAALTMAVVIGAVIGVLGSLFAPQLVALLGGTGELAGPTLEYARIILISEPFLIFTFASNFLIRGEGRARYAMVATGSGALLNIVLDPLFIFAFGWGVGGAALATLLGHMIAAAISAAFYLRGRGVIRLTRIDLRPRPALLSEIFSIGVSGFVRQISTGLVQIIRNNFIVHVAGAIAVSAMGVVGRTILILALPAMGIAQALPPIAGYNFGANNPLRVRRSVWLSIGVASVFMWTGMVIMLTLPDALVRIFTTDTELITLGVRYLRINAFALLVFPTYFVGTAFYQAIGQPMRALLLSLSRPILNTAIMVVSLRTVGVIGIVAADPIALGIGALSVIIALTYSFRTDARLAVGDSSSGEKH